jgi:hypothetical protein
MQCFNEFWHHSALLNRPLNSITIPLSKTHNNNIYIVTPEKTYIASQTTDFMPLKVNNQTHKPIIIANMDGLNIDNAYWRTHFPIRSYQIFIICGKV